jgi:hypothetical protein
VTVAYIQIGRVFSSHLIASPANILGIALVATAYYYLFRPGANAFFSGTSSQAHKPPEGPKQSSKVTSAMRPSPLANRVAGRIDLPAPTPPGKRVRTRRFRSD